MPRKNQIVAVFSFLTYVLMVGVNALANILPINGITTGEVSDSYPNLFAPAGITFSIWGLIYLLLGAYCLYQFSVKNAKNRSFLQKLNAYFIFSSVINSVWIFAWHYKIIWLTVILMASLLYSLVKIAGLVAKKKLTTGEKIFIKIPFGIYFGWITIATIANITTFLVNAGWNGFGISENVWMVIVLIAGLLISSWRALKDNNLAYGLVPVWAYLGILIKHTSPTGFDARYPSVITTVQLCLAILLVVNGYLISKKRII